MCPCRERYTGKVLGERRREAWLEGHRPKQGAYSIQHMNAARTSHWTQSLFAHPLFAVLFHALARRHSLLSPVLVALPRGGSHRSFLSSQMLRLANRKVYKRYQHLCRTCFLNGTLYARSRSPSSGHARPRSLTAGPTHLSVFPHGPTHLSVSPHAPPAR